MPSLLRSFLLTVLCSLLPLSGLVAQSAIQDSPDVPESLRIALMDGELDKALRSLRQLQDEVPDPSGFWFYLEGLTLQRNGELDAAIGAFQRVARDFGEGPWVHKARYRMADAYAEMGNWEESERIWAEEVRWLRGEERQGELASIYFDLAESYLEQDAAAAGLESSDFDSAIRLLDKGLALDLPAEMRSHALERRAWCYAQAGKWKQAANAYAVYLEDHDDPDATLEWGHALRKRGSKTEARRVYEDLAAGIVDEREDADRNELHGHAMYAIGYTFGDSRSDRERAIGAFRRFLQEHPGHVKSGRAAYGVASLHQSNGDPQALTEFQSFLTAQPPATDDLAELKHFDSLLKDAHFQVAELHLARGEYDQSRQAFSRYVQLFPDGSQWSDAQLGILRAERAKADSFAADGEWELAREAFRRYVADHPLDGKVRASMLRIGSLHAEQAAQDGTERETAESHYRQAIEEWKLLVAKHPESQEASEALYRTGRLLEMELDDLDAAVESYRACNFGSYSWDAQERLREMMRPSLTVRTERTWRSDEPATLKLETRNLEEVRVEVYRLDLEAYFRKHLTMLGVEDLDLDLIAADLEFEHRIEDFRIYRPFEESLELPVEGVGVWAVAVSSRDKRATTLVVRSDLDVMVKSSRDSALILAQDMHRSEGLKGTELVLAVDAANQEETRFLEVETGRDGVVQVDFAEHGLKHVETVRVFAKHRIGVASTGLWTGQAGHAVSLEPSAFLYTEASAYQPGALVSWRAVLREVEEGVYHFREGSTWHLTVSDGHGRAILRERMRMSEYGTLHGQVQLAPGAPEGSYRLQLESPAGRSYTRTFKVQPYSVRRLELALDFDRNVYYRGETVELEVRADYSYGEPVAHSPLSVRTPDGKVHQVETDAEGRFKLAFDTRELERVGPMRFEAKLTEESVSESATAFLASTGFRIDLEKMEPVHLLGRDLPLALRVVTLDGEGAERDLTVRLMRSEQRNRRTTEVEVQRLQLRSAEDGELLAALTPQEGGDHRVVIEGKDRFGNPITARAHFFVSGDSDATKLRLLSPTSVTHVGEEVEVEIVNRADSGLALLTFEGGAILEYRLVHLESGTQNLRFEVADSFFPDFELGASMMTGDDLYLAMRGFAVRRELQVKLTPRKDVVHPGEEVVVDLEVTDLQGHPVEAEFSFAAVDSALFEIHPDANGRILSAFRGSGRRRGAFLTESSNKFSYTGTTRTIEEALIAESERLRAEDAWAEGRDRARGQLRRFGEYKGPGDSIPPSAGLAPMTSAAEPMEDLEMELAELGYASNEAIGFGGGAGGKMGGRGGKVARRKGGITMPASPSTPSVAGRTLVGQVDEELVNALTASWQPSIVTDADGKATIRFAAPQASTRWRLMCRGVDRGSAVGQAEASVISRADFLVEMRTPSILLEGDRPSVMARVHNLTGMPGRVHLELEVDRAGSRTRVEGMLEFDRSGVGNLLMEMPGDVPGGVAGEASFHLTGHGHFQPEGDSPEVAVEASVRRSIPYAPWGLAMADQHAGQLTSSSQFTLELPAGTYDQGTWNLRLGLGLDRILIEEALQGPAGLRPNQLHSQRQGPLRNSDFAGQLRGVLAVLQHLRGGLDTRHPAHQALRDRASGWVTILLGTQLHDGGWAWSSRTAAGEAEVSARVVLALEEAADAGFEVPIQHLNRARAFLRKSLAEQSKQSSFTKAILIHALSVSGSVDFGLANSLHRQRASLAPATAAHVAMALKHLDSQDMAEEMLEVSLRRVGPEAMAANWCASPVELEALLLLACMEVQPDHSAADELADSLLSRRPWPRLGAHGMALAAVARHGLESDRGSCEVLVQVGDGEPQVVVLGEEKQSVDLDGIVQLTGVQPQLPIRLHLTGNGRPHFLATLEGFDADPKEEQGEELRVRSTHLLAVPQVYRGDEIRPGFTHVASRVEEWWNTITEVEFGTAAPVSIHFRRYERSDLPPSHWDFLTLDIPLPAGARVVEDSVVGNYEAWVERDGHLLVDIGRSRSGGILGFRLRGLVPGEYRMLPVTVRSAYDSALVGTGTIATLRVLAPGETGSDDFRSTPDELFAIGTAAAEAGEEELAWQQLSELHEGFGDDLRRDSLIASARVMFELAIGRSDADRIVQYFEILKEAEPSLEVPFARMAVVAESYRKLQELERAARILAAVAEVTFSTDLQLVGVLDLQDDSHGADEALHRFWLEYPDFPAVAESCLTLADRMMLSAPEAHLDASLRAAQRDRAVLLFESAMLLQRYLSIYADDPTSADAALNLVSAYLDLEDYEMAARLAAEFGNRHEEPSYHDAFVYTQAVAEWTMGNDRRSSELLRGIATAVYRDEAGRETHSENRDLAYYILAQIHHADRDFAHAVRYYDRIDHVFSDAKLVLEEFRRRELELEEVVEVAPGKRAEFELRYRNLEQAELLVYPVDLMTLYLREKNLSGITSVNLAGIEPVIRREVKLPDDGSMRQQVHEVELKLPGAGAYLVICRADALHASGMVLVSDFELEVVEAGAGSVRVQAVDRKDGHYLRDVDVRVIGSHDDHFLSGRTDPRGIYMAEGFQGAATVIARHGGRHYAFFRGEGAAFAFDEARPEFLQQGQKMLDSDSYLDNVRGLNRLQQETRSKNLTDKQSQINDGVQLNKLD